MNVHTYSDSNHNHTLFYVQFAASEMHAFQGAIKDHIIRRVVDTLYAELLPVMRERVKESLDAAQIAQCIQGEISMAIHNALGGK
jgi:hypothetical protein